MLRASIQSHLLMQKSASRRTIAWISKVGAVLLVAALALVVLGWPAGGDSTVTVTQGDFTLSCNASVAEGETLACTLTNTSSAASAWPVVALVHLSDDTDRALVVGSPIDASFATRQPAAELDSGVEWIGDTLVGYSRFDWSGDAPGAPATTPPSTSAPPANARTVNIAIADDAAQEGSERFYVALGPDGSRGVGLLTTNKAAVTITEDDAKSSNASLTSLSVTAGGTQHTLTATSTTAQTVNVGYQVTEATLTAETSHQRATMAIAATFDSAGVALAAGDVTSLAVTSGEQSASVPLGVGTTTVTLTVTAEDGTTVATHPINIVRSAIGSATTVTVTLDDFVLSCPAEAEEGAVVECTLTNTGALPQPWPVVAVLHSAVDKARATVSEDTVIADVDPAYSKDLTLSEQSPQRDGFNYGYGELFSGGSRSVHRVWGYEKFDWDGAAAAGLARTVTIELHDDSAASDDDGETEVFYVALAPNDYGGLSQLTENTAPILLLQKSGANVIRKVSFGAVANGSAEAVVRIANTDGSTMYWRYRRFGQAWPTAQTRQNAGNLERLSLTSLATGSRYQLQVSFSSTFAGATTHTLSVGEELDSDSSLSALSLGSVTLSPVFATGTTAYTASVDVDTASATVSATTTESSASAVITPADADTNTNGHQVSLGYGQTDIAVTVTAQSGDTSTYTVTVTRAGFDPSLSALSLGGLTISPAFDSATTAYTASVGYTTDSATVTATTTESSATMAILPADADTGADGHQASLDVGQTAITVTVTAKSSATRTYTITVTRAEPDDDPSLSTLSMGATATMSPLFDPATTSYTASVGYETSGVTVWHTARQSATATVAVTPNDRDAFTAAHQSDLSVGQNVITVKVTAQSGKTRTYTITVTRAEADNDPSLSSLSVGSLTLSPSFASATTSYTASTDANTASVMVHATRTQTTARAVITPADADAGTRGHQVSLDYGTTTIRVRVTAQSGLARTYIITVTRTGNDPSLSSLSLSGVTLSPSFGSATTSYSASVGNGTTSTTVTAATNESSATAVITPADADPNTNGHQVNLGYGPTTIRVRVTAQSRVTRTYAITVTRPGNDPSLSSLWLSGVALNPSFSPATTGYRASVGNGVDSVTVSAIAAESLSSAVISPADADGNAADHQVNLQVGINDIRVRVTAQGGAVRTYRVRVIRARPPTTSDVDPPPRPPGGGNPPPPPGGGGPGPGGGGGGGDDENGDSQGEATRLWGADRYATSLAVAREVAELNDNKLDTVVLAGGRSWTDALVAGPLAGALDAALLLTAPGGLPTDTVAWLADLGVSEIVAVGDTDTISAAALEALGHLDPDIERITADDPYAAAVAVARRVGRPATLGPLLGRTVIVASGQVFADALAAGPLAAYGPHPILYADSGSLHPEVAAYLAEHADHVIIMGGTAAVTADIETQIRNIPQANRAGQRPMAITRLGGADRYATAVAFARWLNTPALEGRHCFTPDTVGLATGINPADAAASGPLLARRCAPLLLTAPDRIPTITASYLRRTSELVVFGGTKAINRTALADWDQ